MPNVAIKIDSQYNRAARESERTNWRHTVYLLADRDEPEVIAASQYGNGTPMAAYNGLWVNLGHIADGTADTSAVVGYLKSDEAQALLTAVLAGWSQAWDGSNHRGTLTTDAEDAVAALELGVSESCGQAPTFWDAGEWLAPSLPDPALSARIAGQTDEAIAAIAAELARDADYDAQVDPSDLADVLVAIRDADARASAHEG